MSHKHKKMEEDKANNEVIKHNGPLKRTINLANVEKGAEQ